jgi:hypothetical protein
MEVKEQKEYREERFEFALYVNENIICKRNFRINNFIEDSMNSLEFKHTVDEIINMIDDDLKSKTRVYTWYMTPLVFNNTEEMYTWFKNPKNTEKVRFYETIVVKDDNESEFAWDGEKIVSLEKKVTDGTFTKDLTEKDIFTYEFAFYVNGKKVISTIFDGLYPNYIRHNIDLSNTRGKFEGEDTSKLGFDSYILHKLVNGRQDLIKKIVKELCYVCSNSDNSFYTQTESFVGKNNKVTSYNLNIDDASAFNKKYAKEIAKAKKYFEELY